MNSLMLVTSEEVYTGQLLFAQLWQAFLLFLFVCLFLRCFFLSICEAAVISVLND